MRKLRQWTLNHPLQFVSVFMLVYFTWFSLLEKYAQPVLMIHSKLDDKIPFCEYFIVPYLLWFVWIAGTFVYFYIKSRDDFYHADIAGVVNVSAAAKLHGAAIFDDAHFIAIFLAEESHGTHLSGLGDRHASVLVASDGEAHALVGESLHARQLFRRHLLEMREVKA